MIGITIDGAANETIRSSVKNRIGDRTWDTCRGDTLESISNNTEIDAISYTKQALVDMTFAVCVEAPRIAAGDVADALQ